ncbi:MAG: TauD/TfdA family dioxygenase [Alphaproteobacteria bacterium]|jgi:taurine dioxygenase|nr:TauD/TfdA family dioxygenase [Alphaproteobacteria bacterium]
MAAREHPRRNAAIEARPLGYALGGEILGVDMRDPLDADTVAAIRRAWHAHHVIVLRDQNASPDDILRFARGFGDLDDHAQTPFYRKDGYPELLEITTKPKDGKPSETRNVGRNWHSDYAYTPRPAAASMLYCVEKPPIGGDTMFCNMARAYETLSDTMRGIVDGLHSVYDISLVAGFYERDPAEVAETKRLNPPIAHPAVKVHPESGTRALYVSERVAYFHGMTAAESRPLIDFLCEHATGPENVYRHVWRPGDLVCWDNRTTMHVALTDFDQNQPRHMLRATVVGEPSGFVVD